MYSWHTDPGTEIHQLLRRPDAPRGREVPGRVVTYPTYRLGDQTARPRDVPGQVEPSIELLSSHLTPER